VSKSVFEGLFAVGGSLRLVCSFARLGCGHGWSGTGDFGFEAALGVCVGFGLCADGR